MVTIEADNYDEAIKQARKEKRAAKKQAKIDEENRNMAYLKAYAALGQITRYMLDNDIPCNVWEHAPRAKTIRQNTIACQFDTAEGEGEVEFYKYEPTRVFLDGAGYVVGVELRDMDTNTLSANAVGVHGGKVALIPIPDSIHVSIIGFLVEKAKASQREAEHN